jgi:preprotein translocase subunit SecG
MTTVLVVIHVLVCVFLIAVVLLQRGRGAEIGAVFGGGASSTVFGSRGAGNFLTKLTTGSAVIFMLTSLGLAYLWSGASADHLFTGGEVQEAPAEAPAPAAQAPVFQEVPNPPAAADETAPSSEGKGAPIAPPAGQPAKP